jgi:hypothetical protein
MTKQWNYSRRLKPPYPFVEVALFAPWSASSSVLIEKLQIDTGADRSGIPLALINKLEPRLRDWVEVFDFDDNIVEDIPVYEIGMEIDGMRFNSIKVYGLNSDFGFIGRDLLNSFFISLDGPGRVSTFR